MRSRLCLDDYYFTRDIAHHLGVTPALINTLRRANKLPQPTRKLGGWNLYPKRTLDPWMKKKKAEGLQAHQQQGED